MTAARTYVMFKPASGPTQMFSVFESEWRAMADKSDAVMTAHFQHIVSVIRGSETILGKKHQTENYYGGCLSVRGQCDRVK